MDNVSSALKAFVIAGGILILAGTAALVAIVMQRATSDDVADASQPSGPVDLVLPEGVWIEQVMTNGSRLVLLAADPGGQQYLAVVDALSGERLSLIRVRPGG